MPLWLAIITGFLLGGLVGSLLRLYFFRRRRGLSIVFPPSHCPSCLTELQFWENLPVVSWCLLRGQCRTCKNRIPKREVIIELVFAILGAAAAWLWIT